MRNSDSEGVLRLQQSFDEALARPPCSVSSLPSGSIANHDVFGKRREDAVIGPSPLIECVSGIVVALGTRELEQVARCGSHARSAIPELRPDADLCLISVESLPAGTVLFREVPLCTVQYSTQISAEGRLLFVLAAVARNPEGLRKCATGLTPRARAWTSTQQWRYIEESTDPIVDGLVEFLACMRSDASEQAIAMGLQRSFPDLNHVDGGPEQLAHQLHAYFNTYPASSDSELIRLTMVFLRNAYMSSPGSVELCRFASLMNHSCTPNAEMIKDGNTFTVRLLRNVRSGEELCMNYLPINDVENASSWCVDERRKYLLIEKGFQCRCDRCVREDSNEVSLSSVGHLPPYYARWETWSDPIRPLVVQVDLSHVSSSGDSDGIATRNKSEADLCAAQLTCEASRETLRLVTHGWQLELRLQVNIRPDIAAVVKLSRKRKQLLMRLAPEIDDGMD